MNGAIVPSLMVIGGIGAHRSGALGAARNLVYSTATPSYRHGMMPTATVDMGSLMKWCGGFVGISFVGLLAGSGSGALSDVVAAMLVLTAASFAALYGGSVVSGISGAAPPTPGAPGAKSQTHPQ